MNTKLAAFLFAGFVFGGCSGNSSSESVAGGGFETSDLQAVVVDSSGRYLVGARVWLVQGSSDSSLTTTALDSAIAGFSGEVTLSKATEGAGIEAWFGDTLAGFVRFLDPARHDTIRIVLGRTRRMSLPCSSFAQSAIGFSGSHFVQKPPLICTDSFSVLVPGQAGSMRAIKPFDSTITILPVPWNSLPVWRGFPGFGDSINGNGNGGSLTTSPIAPS